MPDKLKKLRVFTKSGPLIALAIAAGIVLGIVGPTSAQFFSADFSSARSHNAVAAWWRLVW